MTYEQTCPRCGQQFSSYEPGNVADQVVQHAIAVHCHAVDREIVLADLEGVRPDECEN